MGDCDNILIKMVNLTILIPVYNEEKALPDTLCFFRAKMAETEGLEVIIINDGSTDRTLRILRDQLGDNLLLLTHEFNKGYGASLKNGARHASKDFVGIIDADGSYPHEKLFELYDQLIAEKSDMIVGARTGKNDDTNVLRKMFKSILRHLAEYLSDERIPDLNSGLRIVRKDELLGALKYLPDGFSFTTTLTLAMIARSAKIEYVPIDYFKRKGKSKIRPLRDTLNFLQLIVRTVMFFNPLRIFLPISLILIGSSFLVLIVSYLLGRVWDITSILLFLAGFQVLAIGLLADLIDKRLPK